MIDTAAVPPPNPGVYSAAAWECGRCGERFADHEAAQHHADTCDRPTMRTIAASQTVVHHDVQPEREQE